MISKVFGEGVPIYKMSGFEWHKFGIFHRNYNGEKTRVCDPVEVLAIVSDPQTTQWGKLIEFTNAGNQKRHLVVPIKLMMSTPRYLAAELSLRGLHVHSSMYCMSLLREYLNGEYPTKYFIIDYRFLWNHAFFVNARNEVFEHATFQFHSRNEDDADEKIIQKLKSFIIKNRSFFQDLNGRYDRQFLQILGYKNKAKGRIYYFIPQRIFEKEITCDIDEIYTLIKYGLILQNTIGSFCHIMDVAGRATKVYVVRL
jgi:hypothetical protein